MTPRPIYRWKTFWLGLFVACFIAWSWCDSMSSSSEVEWRQIYARNGMGGIWVMRNSTYSAEFARKRRPYNRSLPFIPSPFESPFFARGGSMYAVGRVSGFSPKSFRESYISTLSLSPRETWLLYIP